VSPASNLGHQLSVDVPDNSSDLLHWRHARPTVAPSASIAEPQAMLQLIVAVLPRLITWLITRKATEDPSSTRIPTAHPQDARSFQPNRQYQFRGNAPAPQPAYNYSSPPNPRRSSAALRDISTVPANPLLRDTRSPRQSPERPTQTNSRGRGGGSPFHRRPVSMISTEDGVNSLGMKGYINDFLPIDFFVDSGSQISLLSHAIWERLKTADKSLQLSPSVVSASSVTNHSIEIVGRVSLDFTLCHTTLASACSQYTWHFYVAKGISYECLLGLDFLKAYEGKVDVSNRMCELKNYGSNNVYKLFDLPDYSHVLSVHVCSDTFMQPRSEVLLQASVSQLNGTGTSIDDGGRPEFNNVTGMFIPDPYLAENFKLVGACLLATVLNDKIVVRLLNAHNDPVMLKANVPVGIFEILTYDELERPYDDAIDDMLSKKSKCFRCDRTRCVCSDISDEWDSEPGYSYYSQSRVNAARARGAYYDEFVAAAAKLHLKSDEELISEIDVGDAETSATDKTLILDVLKAHMNVFARSKRDLGRVKMVQFTIDTGSSPPLRSGLRPMSPPQREIVETQINEMLDDGIIEPSYGPWSSPIVLVKKKSGEIRFCVDYRKLNAVTLPDCYPLPLIVDASRLPRRSKIFLHARLSVRILADRGGPTGPRQNHV
jgi:hypothetical protein